MYFCMYSKYNKENYQQKKRNKEKNSIKGHLYPYIPTHNLQ